jgi:tetratricopeptide (TPR) repeat protein
MKKFNGGITDWFLLFLIIFLLFMGAYQRNSLWKSDLELWKDCVKKSPQKERTHHNLGFAYFELEQWEDAEGEFEEALRLNPHYSLSMYNLGLVFYKKGFMDKAIIIIKKLSNMIRTFQIPFTILVLLIIKRVFIRMPWRLMKSSWKSNLTMKMRTITWGLLIKG